MVHEPATEVSRQQLAERIASIHADSVIEFLKKLNCPSEQKQKILNMLIDLGHPDKRASNQQSAQ